MAGAGLLLGFFTFHFGFFHWGHAQFLVRFLDWRIAFTGSAMPLVEVGQESGVGR